MTNILNSTAAIPVMVGLAQSKLAYRLVTPASVLCGCISGLLGVIVYGVIRAPGWGLSAADGIHEVFLGMFPSMLLWTIKGRCRDGILSLLVDNLFTAKAASGLTQSSTSL